MIRLLIILAFLFATGAAFAQGKTTIVTTVDGKVTNVEMVDNPVDTPAFNTFAETDSNGNGVVDKDEAHEAGILAFAVADLNGDGGLDEQEYAAVASGETELPAPKQ
jgi:hypothetical protein